MASYIFMTCTHYPMGVASLGSGGKGEVVCASGELLHCQKQCVLGSEIHLSRRPLDLRRVKRYSAERLKVVCLKVAFQGAKGLFRACDVAWGEPRVTEIRSLILAHADTAFADPAQDVQGTAKAIIPSLNAQTAY